MKKKLELSIDPFILFGKSLNNLFHGKVGNQLVDGQLLSGNGIEATDAPQMLLDVGAVIGYPVRGDHGVDHELEADLAAEVVGDFALATSRVVLVEETVEFVVARLVLLLYAREELTLLAFCQRVDGVGRGRLRLGFVLWC